MTVAQSQEKHRICPCGTASSLRMTRGLIDWNRPDDIALLPIRRHGFGHAGGLDGLGVLDDAAGQTAPSFNRNILFQQLPGQLVDCFGFVFGHDWRP
jgi:hypothetical protein